MSNVFRGALFAAFLGAAFSGRAFAATLNLPGTQPDAFMDTGSITYTAATHTFTVSGIAEYVTNGTQTGITSGVFSLTAVLNKTGGTGPTDTFSPVSGYLSITGNGGTTFFASTTLSDFGYSTSGDDFQFVFGNGSGIDATAGGRIDVLLEGNGITNYNAATTGLDANFATTPFSGATADTFNAVPLPPACWSAATLLLGLGLVQLRRRGVARV